MLYGADCLAKVPSYLVTYVRVRIVSLWVYCEQSLFCSKIRGKTQKQLSENVIRGASGEAASSVGADSRPSNIVLALFFAFFPADFRAKERLLVV